jgi:pilus assembly protein CpaF
MRAEYFGAGPIEWLITAPNVTEIIVNGRDSIWFERAGRLERLDDEFLSDLTFRNFVARMSRDAGFQASLDCPFADGFWRGCRVHLLIPPASGDHAVVTLRRHPQTPWTMDALHAHEWASSAALDALLGLVKGRKNFLIVGGTGSGKTSVLNACLMTLPPQERALVIEDTSELRVPNRASSKLLTRRDQAGLLREIDQSELLRQALRMRPDRIIMGEIRGGEAKDLLMAFATGHTGCMGTLHADSARQALLRLEMLVQLGAPQWSLSAVRTLIWLSVQAIVVVGRHEDGTRKLDGIYRVAALEDLGFLIEKTA